MHEILFKGFRNLIIITLFFLFCLCFTSCSSSDRLYNMFNDIRRRTSVKSLTLSLSGDTLVYRRVFYPLSR